jgi:hypothetical protein
MVFRLTTAAAAVVISTVAALAADPVGRYRVEGRNPGNGSSYRGTVTVERTGDTYRVVWDIGGQTFIGTGIGNNEGLAVAYRSGNQTGIAIYGSKGEDWVGAWTYTGGRDVGAERWERR